MAWKNKPPLTLKERLQRISDSAVGEKKVEPVEINDDDVELESLEKRVDRILGLVNNDKRKASEMLFFVMYDIESTKVRNQVAKYLIKTGCHRIQKSIFLASLTNDKFAKVKSDLTEIQSFYENDDSILIVPVSTDYLQAMKVIGRSIDVDVITKSKNTLFF